MFQPMGRRLVIWSVVVITVLLFNALLSYRAVRQLQDNEQKVIHSYQVLSELRATLSALQDAETGQRGFLLTNQESYLQPYTAALAEVHDHLQRVRHLTQDNPQQQVLVERLGALAQSKLAELKTTVDLQHQHQSVAAQRIVRSNQGQHLMDEMRDVVAHMDSNEQSLLQQRAVEAHASGQAAATTFVVISSLAALLFALFSMHVNQSIRERTELLAAEKKARTELEAVFKSEQQARSLAEDSRAQAESARAEAEMASRLKDEFLATVSHELRTPLNAILGWSSMLRTGQLDSSSSTQAMEAIERNARSQAQLIEDLLDVSRIITGKLRLHVQPVELAPVIEAALDTVRPAADARQIRLQPVLDPRAGAVAGDPDRLQQVVWNLLSNAIKFTPKGGRVQVRLERVNSHVEIIVSDTGQGISTDFLPHVFEQFRQADGSITRTQGGLGLGLSIVRRLVEMHGGTILAESPGKGQGATFTVRLPLMVVRTPVMALDGMPHPVHPVAEVSLSNNDLPALDGVQVMAVDDQPDALAMMEIILTQCGAQVRTANSATEALRFLAEWQPDVIVADIGMPGQDGYALIQQIRALKPEQGGTIPAVALTAYARAEDRMHALSAGFQMHVAKPVEPVELATVVASLLGRFQSGAKSQ